MSWFLLTWYLLLHAAAFLRWIGLGLYVVNLIALMLLALIFL